MDLSISHEKQEDIPEAYQSLYTEQDGKFVLTGIAGVKTEADVTRVMEGTTKERASHKDTKAKLHAFDGLVAEDVRTQLDRIPELEVLGKGNKEEFEEKLEQLTDARVKSRMAPTDREMKTLNEKLEAVTLIANTLQTEKTSRTIGDKVHEACVAAKIRPEAFADVKMLATQVFEVTDDGSVLTKENPFGVTPGLAADTFLTTMQDSRQHWWPPSVGGGAGGSGGGGSAGTVNPWSDAGWNMTEQGRVFAEKGKEKAEQMALAAGTTLGGPRPVTKK